MNQKIKFGHNCVTYIINFQSSNRTNRSNNSAKQKTEINKNQYGDFHHHNKIPIEIKAM